MKEKNRLIKKTKSMIKFVLHFLEIDDHMQKMKLMRCSWRGGDVCAVVGGREVGAYAGERFRIVGRRSMLHPFSVGKSVRETVARAKSIHEGDMWVSFQVQAD